MDVREKLVELIEPHMSGLACEYESGSCELTSCRLCNARNLADHLIANGVTVQEWIPVDDRLPEDWTDVLVSSRFGFLETAVYTGNPGKWRIGWNGDMLEADSITHWMPLPQPPEGE